MVVPRGARAETTRVQAAHQVVHWTPPVVRLEEKSNSHEGKTDERKS
jgi:hypothetical protein